jgi:hypothetical protein
VNKTHKNLLDEIVALHEKKSKDYAHSGDPYANFKAAAQVADGFTGVDAVFATLIGVKLARIRELTAPGRVPNNESLDDSFVDLTNYCAIWTAYRRDQRQEQDALATKLVEEIGEAMRRAPVGVNQRGLRPPFPEDREIPLPHVFYGKGDGTCAVCGLKINDWVARDARRCGQAKSE